jgi:hypothetical protein
MGVDPVGNSIDRTLEERWPETMYHRLREQPSATRRRLNIERIVTPLPKKQRRRATNPFPKMYASTTRRWRSEVSKKRVRVGSTRSNSMCGIVPDQLHSDRHRSRSGPVVERAGSFVRPPDGYLFGGTGSGR